MNTKMASWYRSMNVSGTKRRKQLGKRRITAYMLASNKKAISFAENIGFCYEGTQRHFYVDDDAVVYRMKRDDCPWIKDK